jgi:hypothetical protein
VRGYKWCLGSPTAAPSDYPFLYSRLYALSLTSLILIMTFIFHFGYFQIFFWGGGNSGFFGGIPGRKLSYTHQQETLCRNSNREREWIVIFIFNKSARIWRPRACLESIVHNTYNDTSTVGGRGRERSRKRSSGKPLKFGSEVLCYFMPVSVQPTKVHSRFLPLYMLLY